MTYFTFLPNCSDDFGLYAINFIYHASKRLQKPSDADRFSPFFVFFFSFLNYFFTVEPAVLFDTFPNCIPLTAIYATDLLQASEKEQSQSENAKETNLDLSLGLKAHDDDHENDPRVAVGSFGQPEKLSSVDGSGIKPSANSESESRKRKSSCATNLEMRM
ncbi:hypothetical protein MA16_Dca027528 [Dendrobium catenatum]|uniref:Uncharacterized protein n=1 Tax=Dendrobium catenatum TaxID=906689 RepID=A0A2I0WEW2_9ASPA|nr:hypothetical protein MA16_Dca027528 [Dendrobium catenatum]